VDALHETGNKKQHLQCMWQLSVLNARFGITNKRSRRSPKVPPLMISKLNFGTTAVVFKTSNLGGTYRNNDLEKKINSVQYGS